MSVVVSAPPWLRRRQLSMHPSAHLKSEVRHFRPLSAMFALFAFVALSGCQTNCPDGTVKEGEFCRRSRATGVGEYAGAGDQNSSVTGSGGVGFGPPGSTSSSASGGAGATTGGPGSSVASGQSGTSALSSTDRCMNQPSKSVCDGTVMYRCDLAGTTTGQEMCANEMYCQFGLSTGKSIRNTV